MLPTDAGERLVEGVGGRGAVNRLVVLEDRAAGPVGVTGNGVGRREPGVGPARVDRLGARMAQRQLERLAERQWPVRYQGVDVVVGHHHLVAQRVDEGHGDAGRKRGDETHPSRREPRASSGTGTMIRLGIPATSA